MLQPKSFVHLDCPKKVYSLFKTIYDLKQLGEWWYGRYNFYFLQSEIKKCVIDPNICIKTIQVILSF